MFECQTVANCGEGALASCLDMEQENVERAACGSGGMDAYGRAWPVDKETNSCCRAVGRWRKKEVGKGVAGGGPHRPFIYFDPGSAGGPGRAHARLPRRAELPCPLSHLAAPPLCLQLDICVFGATGCMGFSFLSYLCQDSWCQLK